MDDSEPSKHGHRVDFERFSEPVTNDVLPTLPPTTAWALGGGHLDADRLGADTLTPGELAHLPLCVQCRTARKQIRYQPAVGRYRVLGLIGAGGMGEVYAATERSRKTRCALKMIRPMGQQLRRRFEQEAKTQRRVSSDHVLPLLDVFKDGSSPVLVLPYVEGPDLGRVLKAHGPLPPDVAAAWFVGIVDGVAALHDAGIVHRDLKPSNVLLDPSSGAVVPKVADFGLAKWLSEEPHSDMTRTGVDAGTRDYASPEQRVSARDARFPADVWSLGVIAVEMFTGALARSPENPLPPPWEGIVDQLLRTLPAERVPNARALAALLPPAPVVPPEWAERCRAMPPVLRRAGELFEPTGETEPPLERSTTGRPKRSWRAVAFAGLVVSVALFLGLLAVPERATSPPIVSAPEESESPTEESELASGARYPHRMEERIAPTRTAPPAAATRVEQADLVRVHVKTYPWSWVVAGDKRVKSEEDLFLAPGHHELRLEPGHDQFAAKALSIEVVAGKKLNLCWDFERGVDCSL